MVDRDQVSVGVLVGSVPRDVVDGAVAAGGAERKRVDGKLPPHVVVYLLMGLWLFADEDYEEVAAKVTGCLDDLGVWAAGWTPPTASAVTQARKRLPPSVVQAIFEGVAAPLATSSTPGAWLGAFPGRVRRLVAIDGFDLDLADSDANADAFGRAGTVVGADGASGSAFPKARVVTLSECATHAPLSAAVGAWATSEPALAAELYPRLREDEVLMADRNFYSYQAFAAAVATGADLIWRAPTNLTLPVITSLPDGSYTSVLVHPDRRRAAREKIVAAARAGEALDEDSQGRLVRVVDYDVPDREGSGELVTLLTTILDPDDVPATSLAGAYAQRWEAETSFSVTKTTVRGPGKVLRSRLPDLVHQEIWALLLVHHALAALATRAADAAGLDPDRVSMTRTLRITRRTATGTAGFSP